MRTPRGYVVDHKTAPVRYAVSVKNYNPKKHRKVRELRPGETVLGFRPRRKESAPQASSVAEAPSTEVAEELPTRKD